ncbi:MAG: GerAB/ArcD/ProY family transporter, partial [Oscillospiraceae bacterium]|jgi:hypothetical protein|nr:GerAB/ArcD/ProY family transporter [Oscillospiraceae bacterium]
MIFVVGSLGYKAVERMAMPFFSATKLINVMQSFDKLEAVLLSVWVVSDFIIITVFVFFITHVLQKLFNTPDSKHLATPVVFFGYIGGVFLAASRFEMETFSNSNFTLTMNITTGFILPILVLAVGKLRKVV